jgi:shikimate dehydrogenase
VRRLAGRGAVRAGSSDPTGFGLVVNATPAGMREGDPLPVDAARLDRGAVVADLVTKPAITPLLDAARRRGAAIVTGEDMFAIQAGTMADLLLAPRGVA